MKKATDQVTPSQAKLWLNEKDKDSNIPLHYAARYNYLELTKLIVEAGSGKNT